VLDRRSPKSRQRLVSDELWELAGPLIPEPPPTVNGRTGRPRVDDRAALDGILFVLETGVAWPGVWDELHQRMNRLGQQGLLDWSRACLDSVRVRAKKGAG
jgi:hypothetical protein